MGRQVVMAGSRVVKATLLALLAGLGCTLSGCGCTKDGFTKCTDKHKSGSCTDIQAQLDCYDSEGCCDHEEEGVKMKVGSALLVTMSKSTCADLKDKCA